MLLLYFPSATQFVRKVIPVEQGLRQALQIDLRSAPLAVRKVIPVEQGLRLYSTYRHRFGVVS